MSFRTPDIHVLFILSVKVPFDISPRFVAARKNSMSFWRPAYSFDTIWFLNCHGHPALRQVSGSERIYTAPSIQGLSSC